MGAGNGWRDMLSDCKRHVCKISPLWTDLAASRFGGHSGNFSLVLALEMMLKLHEILRVRVGCCTEMKL